MKREPLSSFNLAAVAIVAILSAAAQTLPDPTHASQSTPIPMDQLGSVAGKQYQGDGLSASTTPDGARLRCAFQQLDGQVTREGLWLSSTADDSSGERFRVMAVEVGRSVDFGVRRQSAAAAPLFESDWMQVAAADFESGAALRFSPQSKTLSARGAVSVKGQTVQFTRDGLTEEYSVSADGVRQDFIVEHRPEGEGELRVELDVTGAKAEPLVNGARLTLDGSGRKLAYNRLRVADARGQELTARLEVTNATRMVVVVDDAAAVYPVRIDPTFSDADWISMGGLPGANGTVYAALADADGNLYIGGKFTSVGEVYATNIAKWDGSAWSALGSGQGNLQVNALALSGADLFAGGYNIVGGQTAATIAKWDGSAWSPLGSGVSGGNFPQVYALAVSGTDLYVGGTFTTAGGVAATNIAKWNGSGWSPLGLGLNDTVRALAVSGPNLYAGGGFSTAGGVAANRVAKWDGNAWSPLGLGISSGVLALAVSGPNLYAGGGFTNAGGVAANRIAKWDGSAWAPLGLGLNGNMHPFVSVYTLAARGTNLYAGGDFTTAGGLAAIGVAKWNGSVWSPLGSGISGGSSGPYAYAFALSSANLLYVGGDFAGVDDEQASRIASWDGNAWSALCSGVNDNVQALAISGTNLYVGGRFSIAGGKSVNRIAKWNGNVWSALDGGVSGVNSPSFPLVKALVAAGNDLYVGGYFTKAGGISANHVAKWNGSAWSALGTGMNSQVRALAVIGEYLYAGGDFTTAGGTTVNSIAKWNGSSWSSLGTGMGPEWHSPYVFALTASGTDLYAGGTFTTAGGNPANRIAKWDGSSWSSLGAGMNSSVTALAASGTNLYAGGSFTTAGGTSVVALARWDGNAWSPLGTGIANGGISASISALVTSGTDLYAGGQFATADGMAANNIAKWDGNTWFPLGSGMGGSVPYVFTLAVSGTNLYAGGTFAMAGDKVSAYVARANVSAARGRFSNPVFSSVTGFSCIFLDATVGQPYRIETSPWLAAGSWTDFTNFTYTAPIVIYDPTAAATTNVFFRAITP